MFTVESPKSVSCDAMTNVGSCLDENSWCRQRRSQVVKIVDVISLKFGSDEAAQWKAVILELLFYSQQLLTPSLSIETSLPKVNLHCCCFIWIVLIIALERGWWDSVTGVALGRGWWDGKGSKLQWDDTGGTEDRKHLYKSYRQETTLGTNKILSPELWEHWEHIHTHFWLA